MILFSHGACDVKVVFWLPVLTEHQVHTLRAFQHHLGREIHVMIGQEYLPDRRLQGWNIPDVADLKVELLPNQGWWRSGRACLLRHDDAMHLFGGLWMDRRLFSLLVWAQWHGLWTGLISEPYSEKLVGDQHDDTGISLVVKKYLRHVAYQSLGSMVVRRLRVVFAIAPLAMEQFRRMGARPSILAPFGYFVPRVSAISSKKHFSARPLRLIFVGSMIERKGWKIAVEAVNRCRMDGLDVILDLYGSTEQNIFLPKNDGITFRGRIPFGESQKVISQYDLLLVPSIHDGWGVVVNEAILQGVPSIVSSHVGAKILVEQARAGLVVAKNTPAAWAKAIVGLVGNRAQLERWGEAARRMSAAITPESAAIYLLRVLSAVREERESLPTPPWIMAND